MCGRLAMAASIWLIAGCSSATNGPQATSAATATSSNVVVTFTGAVSGTMTPRAGFAPSCQLPLAGEVPPVWVYRVFGTVGVYHDVAFEIAVDDYKGPATYRNPAASVTVGPIGTDLKTSQTFRSTTNATLVVNADELSGNVEATLHAYPSYHGGNLSSATVHAQGAFICSRLKATESP
jgi:hypothetical protein